MSREEKDLDYKPRITTVKLVRSSRRTRKVEQVNYSEAEFDTDTDGESNLSNSGTIVVDSPRQRDIKVDKEQDWELGTLWTLGTLNTRIREVSQQTTRLAQQQTEREMAESNNIEKLMEMMLKMRQEDRREERERG